MANQLMNQRSRRLQRAVQCVKRLWYPEGNTEHAWGRERRG